MSMSLAYPSLSTIARFARIVAGLSVVVLFSVGSFPATGHAFPGTLHWVAHIGAYGVIGGAAALGWPQRPALLLTGLVASLGAVHEVSEIITHQHGFEGYDALVNALGAAIGVTLARLIRLPEQTT